MSFICQNCGTVQDKGTKPVKKVTKVRNKVYPQRFEGEGYYRKCIDNGGSGQETVEELDLCEKCASKFGTPVVVQ